MKQYTLLLQTVILAAFLPGCYTQFVMIDRTPPAETVEWVIDSATGDTVKVIKQVDTIQVEDRQTCVWERDLMGYPQLRCYDSFYPRDWFWYNNSPWWYRNDPYWYDYSRCPRFYYYDPSCGSCRYTGSSYYRGDDHDNPYHHDNNQGNSESVRPGGTTMYPRVQGVPGQNAHSVQSSQGPSTQSTNDKTATTSSGSRQSGNLILPADNQQKPRIISERSSGVPQTGVAQPIPLTPQQSAPTASAAPKQSTPPAVAPPASSGSSSQQQNDSDTQKSHRRNPRSW